MKTEKKEFKMRAFSNKKMNPKFYQATPEEVNNPELRFASPAKEKNKYGHFQNGRITAIRPE